MSDSSKLQASWSTLSICALNTDLPAAYLGPQSGFQNSLSLVGSSGGKEGQTGTGLWHLSAKKESSIEKWEGFFSGTLFWWSLKIIIVARQYERDTCPKLCPSYYKIHWTFSGILRLLVPGRSPRTLPSTKMSARSEQLGEPSSNI